MSRLADRSPATARRAPYLLVSLILLTGSWLGCGAGVTEEQKAAMARISELGGQVNFKRGGYEVDLKKTPVEDKDLAHLKQIPNLKNVDLQGTRIGDGGLEHLKGIETLELVYLQRTVITREGLEDLKKSLPKADISY
jgi:hypothetical protein